jgi:hypothetical protein
MSVVGVTLEPFKDLLRSQGLGYCFLIELEYHHRLGSVAILASDIPPLNLVLAA